MRKIDLLLKDKSGVGIVKKHSKQLLCIIFLTTCTIYVKAENVEHKQQFGFNALYNYNLTNASELAGEFTYQNALSDWVDIQAGFQASTRNAYALLARGDFKFNANAQHRFGLRNQYLYDANVGYNAQFLNALLAIDYTMKYGYFAMGAMCNVYTPIRSTNPHSTLVEPVLFCYDFEGRLFPSTHFWNLALQITNIRPFHIEKAQSPSFTLKGNYNVYNSNKSAMYLNLDLGVEYAGFGHINIQFYEIYSKIGISWEI